MRLEKSKYRETMPDLRKKLLFAEQQRLAGQPTISLEKVYKRLKDRIRRKDSL